jgi:carbon monoxide dehydrogenase subunit G
MFEATVAYMKFKFRVVIQLARLQEPSEFQARIEGRPIGLIGRLSAKSLTLLNDPSSETNAMYSVDSTLNGKGRSIGQPVLRTKVKQMERRFAERLRATFAPVTTNAQEAR